MTFPAFATLPSLEDVIARKRESVARRAGLTPLESLRALASLQPRPPDVGSTLRENRVALVAQIMAADLGQNSGANGIAYDPVGLARQAVVQGAHALAVVTEDLYHGGALDHLTHVCNAVGVPVIRQDFVVEEYQVVEARAGGAAALTLIAAVLGDTEMRRLISATQRNRMNAVVLVHDEAELNVALSWEPRVIAIDNRDRHSGAVDLDKTRRLMALIPARLAVLSMGGLRTAQDVAQVAQTGVDAVLVPAPLLLNTEAEAIRAALRA